MVKFDFRIEGLADHTQVPCFHQATTFLRMEPEVS